MTKKTIKPITVKLHKEKFQLPLIKYDHEFADDCTLNRVLNDYTRFKRIKDNCNLIYSKYRRLILIIESQYLNLLEQLNRNYDIQSGIPTNYEYYEQIDEKLLEELGLNASDANSIMENYTVV